MIEDSLRKFFILQWKNVLLKRRHPVLTLCEILVPTLLFVGIVAIRNTGGDDITPAQKDAVVKRVEHYPIQYCESLVEHTYNGTLAPRLLGYTNRPAECEDCSSVNDSLLVHDLMELVSRAVDDFLWPFCNATASFVAELDLDKNVTSFWNVSQPQGMLSIEKFYDEDAIIDENSLYQSNPEGYGGEMLGGIIFKEDFEYILDDDDDGEPSFPPYSRKGRVPPLDYKIRLSPEFTNTNTDLLFPVFQLSGPGYEGDLYSDFVKYQNLIELAYVQLATGTKVLPDSLDDRDSILWMTAQQEMAYPSYLENNLAAVLDFMLPMFTVLSFCFIVPPLMKRIVHEKQTGVKELMKLMGLPNWMHWTSWFLNAYVTSAISVLIMVVLVCVEWVSGIGAVLEFSNPILIYIFFMLYAAALIMSLFAISSFFDSPNLALAIGVIVHLITYLAPSVYIDDQQYIEMSGASKISLSLIPNIALWWGIKIISVQEGRGSGVQWSTLGDRSQPSDQVTMAVVFTMLAADVAVYALVVWYIDGIRPGKYGVRRKWYFPAQLSYWLPNRAKNRMFEKGPIIPGSNAGENFESEPEGEAGVVVRNLKKVFCSFRAGNTVAVEDVSFSAYRGQITALLGHNGAGKTTTMSVLTGMHSPSGGRAFINGYDIGTEMSRARRSLGLCPQHNMLFSDLTVREHLVFFAMLKGMARKNAVFDADRYVGLLNLAAKSDVLVTKLSGGMKRRVNLGIALIGDSDVVMLDEPTSGMDPEARRGMWDLLQEEKRTRTILLTTHFMEEADVLGDRIAIMSRGKVTCYGTPIFLKRKFGNGYTLAMSRGGSCDAFATLGVVSQVVPGACLKSEASGEIVISLPDTQVNRFAELFETLEREKDRLDVLNFGLSVTTMEDVFLKVGTTSENASPTTSSSSTDQESRRRGHRRDLSMTSFQSDFGSSPAKRLVEERLTGWELWRTRMWGLLAKRATYASRRWILFSVMALVPVFIALICQMVVNDSSDPVRNYDPITFDLDAYPGAITYVNSDPCPYCMGLAESFVHQVTNSSEAVETSTGENLTATILEVSEDDLATYRSQFIVAGNFLEKKKCLTEEICFDDYIELVGVYNTVPTHSRPLVQNLISNTLLTYLEYGVSSSDAHNITTTNHPLPAQKTGRLDILTQGSDSYFSPYPFAYGVALSIGIGILIASFVIFPLVEKVTNAKQVQMMTGLDPGTFWLSNALPDCALYALCLAATLTLLVLMDKKDTFTTNNATGTLVLVLVMYGACALPMSYAFSYFSKSPASGFASIIVLNVLAGAIAPTLVWLLRLFGDFDGGSSGLVVASEIVRYLFILMPAFPFARSIMAIVQIQEENTVCSNGIDGDVLTSMCEMYRLRPEVLLIEESREYAQCCGEPYVQGDAAFCGEQINVAGNQIQPVPCHNATSFFTWEPLVGINTDLVFLAVNIAFYCTLLVALELGYISKLRARLEERRRQRRIAKGKCVDGNAYSQLPLDDDVRAEQVRIRELYPRGERRGADALVVTDLTKHFRQLTAVRGLTFGVHHGECFGLLGINGAGKTTTFRMLTGDEQPSTGSASLLGFDLSDRKSDFLAQVGYCPQFDSIVDVLTGREMLRLFGRLRGLPKEALEAEVDHWLEVLGIGEYADRQCGSYSGGNKRKLNVAMALMGDPPVVFLDEPSTGVDPVARRRLWNVIASIQKNGQSVVLTSHSMEECEALCDRLCIMVNGQFRCLGGSQHLKAKFGQGFTILLKLDTRGGRPEESGAVMAEIRALVTTRFNMCVVKDEHKDYIHFHVGDTSTPWHQLFETMESVKREFPAVEDYSVSETTLEQVFLSFAKHQRQEDDEDVQGQGEVATVVEA